MGIGLTKGPPKLCNLQLAVARVLKTGGAADIHNIGVQCHVLHKHAMVMSVLHGNVKLEVCMYARCMVEARK